MSCMRLTTLVLLIAHRATSTESNIECTAETVAQTCFQNSTCIDGICAALCDNSVCINENNTQCVMTNGKATCKCLEGFVGVEGHQGCFRSCMNSEEDCPRDTMCIEGKCINPCLYIPRHSHDVCNVQNHQIEFRCLDGYTGNPYEGCTDGSCSSNKDCSSDLACVGQKCLDPCLDKCMNICGCSVSNHTCNCPVGYIESIAGCKKGNCTDDDECGQDKACIGYTCTDPCTDKCEGYKSCVVFQHKYYCKCKGWQNINPLEDCTGLARHTGLRIRKFFRNLFYGSQKTHVQEKEYKCNNPH